MIIRVNWIARTDRLARQLRATIGDHLIRVRVGTGARPSLKNVDREMLVQFALDHLFRRLNDEGGPAGVEWTKIVIGLGGAPFDQDELAKEGGGELITTKREIKD